MSEAAVVKSVCAYLTAVGVFHWRNNTGAARFRAGSGERVVRFGVPGSPDILGILPGGRALGIECKAGRGRLSPAQRAWGERMTQLGALWILARSIDDVKSGLEVEHDG